MSQSVTWNGQPFTIPDPNDTGWGQSLTNYLAALPSGALQKSGGAFTLTADTNFGATFGLVSKYFTSRTANAAAAGAVRLAVSDTISFRNNANNGDLTIGVDGSNNLAFEGTKVIISGAIVNADVANAAGIVYSKLNLSASIVNADVASAAAIAFSKMAALSASIVPVTDASGFLVSSATTATELGYVHGVTSALQTQMDLKAPLASPTFTGTATAATLTVSKASFQIGGNQAYPILQVVQGTKTASFSTTSSTLAATGLSAAITPKFNTSKIKVTISSTLFNANGNLTAAILTVKRGATDLGVAGSGFTTLTGTFTTNIECPVSLVFYDSPATTSPTTYEVYIRSSDNATSVRLNNIGAQSVILLEEVSQ